EDELRTDRELDLVFLETADAYLRPLQIDQYADRASRFARERTHHLHPLLMLARGAVRKIEPHDIHAGIDHVGDGRRITRCGAKGGDDLGTAGHAHYLLL